METARENHKELTSRCSLRQGHSEKNSNNMGASPVHRPRGYLKCLFPFRLERWQLTQWAYVWITALILQLTIACTSSSIHYQDFVFFQPLSLSSAHPASLPLHLLQTPLCSIRINKTSTWALAWRSKIISTLSVPEDLQPLLLHPISSVCLSLTFVYLIGCIHVSEGMHRLQHVIGGHSITWGVGCGTRGPNSGHCACLLLLIPVEPFSLPCLFLWGFVGTCIGELENNFSEVRSLLLPSLRGKVWMCVPLDSAVLHSRGLPGLWVPVSILN